MWFGKIEVEREALDEAITTELDDAQLNISPLELQIAYKLRLAQYAECTTGKYFEDVLHLYETFEESLNRGKLEEYVTDLGVKDYYDLLKRA